MCVETPCPAIKILCLYPFDFIFYSLCMRCPFKAKALKSERRMEKAKLNSKMLWWVVCWASTNLIELLNSHVWLLALLNILIQHENLRNRFNR